MASNRTLVPSYACFHCYKERMCVYHPFVLHITLCSTNLPMPRPPDKKKKHKVNGGMASEKWTTYRHLQHILLRGLIVKNFPH